MFPNHPVSNSQEGMGAGTLVCGGGLVGQLVTAWGQPGSRGLSLELGLD